MRLIDADKIDFSMAFGGSSDFGKDLISAAQKLIDMQPTAFDKEKVIDEIEYNIKVSRKYSTGLRDQGHIEAFDEAISIVKKGGINNILL